MCGGCFKAANSLLPSLPSPHVRSLPHSPTCRHCIRHNHWGEQSLEMARLNRQVRLLPHRQSKRPAHGRRLMWRESEPPVTPPKRSRKKKTADEASSLVEPTLSESTSSAPHTSVGADARSSLAKPKRTR